MAEVESSWDSFLGGDKDEDAPEGGADSQEEVDTPPTPPPEPPKATPAPTTPAPTTGQNAEEKPAVAAAMTAAPAARKAQRTRRAKVNVNATVKPSTESPAPTTPTEKKEAVTKAAADQGDYEDEYDEPNAVLAVLSCAADGVFTVLKAIWRLVSGIYGGVRGYLPGMVGVTLLYVTVYLLATYSVSPSTSSDLPDLPARLHYLIRAHVWSLLPVALGLLFGFWRNNDKHFRFARDSFEQAVLLFLNTVVLVTYASADNFHWLWSLLVGLLIFRFLYWVGVLYAGATFRRIMSAPTLFTNVTMAIYNFGVVIGQDLGYVAHEEVSAPPQPEPASGGFWDYQSICHVMEKAFCTVDDTTPSKIRQYSRH